MAGEGGGRSPLGRARLHRRYWLTPMVLALVLVTVVVTGGFRAAPAVGVRTFAVGESITLRRWQLVVTGVELVDTTTYESPQAPALRVGLTATWTGDRSTFGLADGLVGVVVPGGPAVDPRSTTPSVDHYIGGFDPDLPRPVSVEFPWPAGATETTPPVPLPPDVLVVISNERPAQNFLFSDEWSTTRPIGHVNVPVRDRRERR